MKNSNIIFIILFLLILLVLACFGNYSEISDFDVVSGVAIDNTDGMWQVTCEICVPSTDNAFGSKSMYVKGKGYTLENAFECARRESANELYTDSVQLYLVNSALFKDTSVLEYLKGKNINMRAVTACTDGNAAKLLEGGEEENDRAKSMSLVKKIKDYASDNSLPQPNVLQFMRSERVLSVSDDKDIKEKAL